jgi:hypothetical protein
MQTGIGAVDVLCQRFKVHTMRRLFPAPKYPTPDLTRYFVVKFDESFDLDEVVNVFSQIPFFIEKAEKVATLEFLDYPNDEHFGVQWHHLNQYNDCDIDTPEAWNIEKGSDSVILAVPDTGVKYDHPDLNDNIWINWDEYYGTPNYDDDGNGYVDDIRGWNWGPGDPKDPMDAYGHGTKVAGIIAAETNNEIGVAGIAGGWYPGQQGCRIMCLRLGHTSFDMDDAAESFIYATDKEATAINCSWYSWYSEYFKDAIDYALYHGVLIVAAAGNWNGIYCNDPNWFYLSMVPGVLVVAATDQNDQRAIFPPLQASNYGPCIGVSAPGKDIMSTCIESPGYCTEDGTSVAAPMVVGLAGLLKSHRSDWGRQLLWDAVVKAADPITDQGMGSGRINAHYSLKQTYTPSAPSNFNATANSWDEMDLTWNDNSDNELGFKVERKTSSSEFSEIASLAKNSTSYIDNNVSAGITYYYRIKAYSVNGDSYSNTDDALIPDSAPDPPSYIEGHFEWVSHQVELTWSDSSNNEQGFIIERRSEWEPSFQEIGSVGPNVTTFYDPNVSWDTIYHYRVKAYNPRGYAYSWEVMVYVGSE